MTRSALNVLGEPLQECGRDPLTGYYRDGCCNTGEGDMGLHLVCAVVTDEFLHFSREQGNDLMTPAPQFGFSGLKAGDRCDGACAYRAGKKPLTPESPHPSI